MTTYFIGFMIFMGIVMVALLINNLSTILVYPCYLFGFINKQIDDDFSTEQINNSKLLIDDDGLETLSLEDLKKMRKEEKIIPLYVKFSNKLDSYLYTIFKDRYIVFYKKVNKTYKPGDFIVVNNYENYYIREVCNDENNKVAVFKPKGKDIDPEYVSRMDIIGEVVGYNKYRIGWV